jgi:hypothetical protein
MKSTRGLPVPFLILLLAGAVSLVSIFADRGAHAGIVRNDPVQMQTIEQERMAEFYFRILSWVSGLRSPASGATSTAPKAVKSPRRGARRERIEFCAFSTIQNFTNRKLHTHTVD